MQQKPRFHTFSLEQVNFLVKFLLSPFQKSIGCLSPKTSAHAFCKEGLESHGESLQGASCLFSWGDDDDDDDDDGG